MRYQEFLSTMAGKKVAVYVRGLSDAIHPELGGRMVIWGELQVYDDFITVRQCVKLAPAVIKLDDIVVLEEEPDLLEDEEDDDDWLVDHDALLSKWENENGGQKGYGT